MAKFIKWLIGFSIFLVFLFIVMVVALPLLINPNDYKPEIEQQVFQKTGHTLSIDGNIDLSFSLPLSLSFELGKTTLGHGSDFSANTKNLTKPHLFSVDQISLKAALLPLVQSNKLNIGEVVLDGASLYLVKNETKQANWETLSAGANNQQTSDVSSKESKSAENQTPNNNSPDTRALPEIYVEGVKVINTYLIYDDRVSGQLAKLDNFSINISEVVAKKPIEIAIETKFDATTQKIKGQFNLDSLATFDLDIGSIKLANTNLTLKTEGDAIPGGSNTTTLGGDINLNIIEQTLKLSQIKLNSYDVNLQANLNVNKLFSDLNYQGKFNIDEFSPKDLTKKLSITLPEMKQADVLEKLSMNIEFTGTKNALKLSSLNTFLDEIIFKGQAEINNFSSPSFKAKLDINELDLDKYALKPVESEQKEDVVVKSNKSTGQVPLIPVDVLRPLNLHSELTIAKMKVANIKMDNILMTLTANKGIVKLAPVQSDFYQGKLKVSSTLDVRSKTPKINFTQDFNGIDLGQLLQDATQTQEFTGKANIVSTVNTTGNTIDNLIKHANGNGKFHVNDGHVKKLDILHTIRKAQAMLKGQQQASLQEEKDTAFTELKGTYKVTNGVFRNNDLYTKTPLMKVTGKGYADLPKEYLDYTLKVTLLNSLDVDKNTGTTDFKGTDIPYTIKGKFSELAQEADLKGMVEDKLKEKAKEKVNKVIEEKLGGKLKGLFKF